eukprot:m.202782 g.202782  ORF g.202782 m.202782 type:complete len:255 (+) comp32835_c0_seq25:210-974(+)
MSMARVHDQDIAVEGADRGVREDPHQPQKGKGLLGLYSLSLIFGIAACAMPGIWRNDYDGEQYDCFGDIMCILPRAFSILAIFATFLSMFYVSRLANSIEIQRNQYLFTVTVLPGVLYVATVVSYFNDQLGEAENFGASFALYVVAIILVFFAFLVARKIKSVQVSNLAAYLAAQANQVDVPVPVPIGMPVPIQMQSSTPPPPPSYGDAIVGAPPPSQSENIGQKLRVLAQLKNDGILTETEFVNKKAELLSEM